VGPLGDPATSERADVVAADLGDAAAVVRATGNADALFWVEPQTETISQEALRGSLRSAGLGDKQVEGLATLAAWAHARLRPALRGGQG
jgi:hypothetical protein